MNNHKLLQFISFFSKDKIKPSGNKPDNAQHIRIILQSRVGEKNPFYIKSHITNPAMDLMLKWLVEKYGEEGARSAFKDVCELIQHLNDNNTALLSTYIPTIYLKDEALNLNNNNEHQKNNKGEDGDR